MQTQEVTDLVMCQITTRDELTSYLKTSCPCLSTTFIGLVLSHRLSTMSLTYGHEVWIMTEEPDPEYMLPKWASLSQGGRAQP